MTTLVLCNIGNSDLKADGERPKLPRPDGERLWQTFADHAFALPIVEPCLNHLLQETGQVDRMALFYTDQPATPQTTAPDRYGVSLRDKDTLWYAQIAARLLRERFDSRIGTIDLIRVERGNGQMINPSLYDEAFDAYSDLVTRSYVSGAACYVLMAGGIPACNVALQIQALSAYGERCRFIYQPEGGTPYDLRVGDQIQATFHRATALEALGRRDFATALQSVSALKAPDAALLALLRYACYRESFDFARARMALAEGVRQASGELRTFLAALLPDLATLDARTDTGGLLREVYASARITFNNGRYADFLGRVFRFQEAALRHIVEARLGLPTDMGKPARNTNLPRYLQLIAESPALKAHLDGQQIDDKPLIYDKGPNRPVMSAMLDFLVAGGMRADGKPYLGKDDKSRFGQARKQINKMNDLAELRNQSIIAHGFAGVSREELDAAYKGGAADILADMAKVMEMIGLGGTVSPFDRIADTAADVLRGAT
ncbi:MAG: hypothetical protein WCI67_17750 [Chloroflexales bacterium]